MKNKCQKRIILESNQEYPRFLISTVWHLATGHTNKTK
jgi:hypothetical protein